MDNVDAQVLKRAEDWLRGGHRAVLGTIVRTWGSAPRPVGSLVVIRDDGLVAGSVSGGCIEDDLVDRVRRKALAAAAPQRVTYGVTAEEAFRFGLPCGGTIELILEPLGPQSKIAELLARVAVGRQTVRTLDMKTGDVTLADGTGADLLVFDDERLVTAHGPRWRLLVIGAGQLTHYVAQMALALDYQVTICDPREEYADGWLVPGTELLRTMPDDTVTELRPDSHTAILALTHDPKLDDLALMEALKSPGRTAGAPARAGRVEERRAHAARNRSRHPRRNDGGEVRLSHRCARTHWRGRCGRSRLRYLTPSRSVRSDAAHRESA